jgi:sulfopyruvate decarboxylase alpha subunit
MDTATKSTWQDELYTLLRKHKITQFAYVPDAGHRVLIDRSLADPEVHSVALTTEEEGVALLAGADLGGARGVLLMQSSGVGNCINMLSLVKGGKFPFLTLVSMRGEFGEGNPWQYPMGQAVQPVLEAMGVICLRVEKPEEVVPTVSAALTMVFQGGTGVAVLLTQKLIGAKVFGSPENPPPPRSRPTSCSTAAPPCRRCSASMRISSSSADSPARRATSRR